MSRIRGIAYTTLRRQGHTFTCLVVNGADLSICGSDTAGDSDIDDAPPEDFDRKRVTCEHCLTIIEACRMHDKRATKEGANQP